jgi:peptide-methionine (S)-S-oxide reductase
VGYTGGTEVNPTYHSLGEHSESIEIEYDPRVISYEDLLTIFWEGHDPFARSWSTQYRAAIFYHNDEQKRLAEKTRDKIEATKKMKVRTEILPDSAFNMAEAYHQKYSLRGNGEIMKEFRAIYPSDEAFVNSTAAARVNGYLGGFGSFEDIQEAVNNLGLSAQGRERLLAAIRKQGEKYGASAFCVHKR